MESEQKLNDKGKVSDEALREAGQLLRSWLSGTWRQLPVALPILTAIIGALLFYCARVYEASYLRHFGLRPDQFGDRSPDLSVIAFPSVLFALWLSHGFYRGFVRPIEARRYLDPLFNKIFLRGSGRNVAIRTLLFVGIAPALTLFATAHWASVWYGKVRAVSVVYRVANQGCRADCLFYQKGTYGPKRVAIGEIGIPVVSGDGRVAILTSRGTVIIKMDDVELVNRINLPKAKERNTSIFNNIVYGHLL